MRILSLLILPLCLTSCFGASVAREKGVIEELRTDLAEVHDRYTSDLVILEEKLQETDGVAQQVRRQIESELSVLELKLAMIEKEQERLLDEIAQLKKENEHYNQELARDMHGLKAVLEEMISVSNPSDPDVAFVD